MSVTCPPAPPISAPSLAADLAAASRRIAPLWPLTHFVAVNPFLGLTDLSFLDAAVLLRRIAHDDILMPAGYYLEQIASGRLADGDFQRALADARDALPSSPHPLPFATLADLRRALAVPPDADRARPVLAFADFLDRERGSEWAPFVVDEVSKWCSVFFDQGQSVWTMPGRDRGLFAAWKSAASLDANPELTGLSGFRSFVRRLPDDALSVVSAALDALGFADRPRVDFLHRVLFGIRGWSGYVQYRDRERRESGRPGAELPQLLAIRLAYDWALFECFRSSPDLASAWLARTDAEVDAPTPADLVARYVAQVALEHAYRRTLIAQLRANRSPLPSPPGRKSVQAVFCIDVRSEPFRRALDRQSALIETLGFAGFFGLPLQHVPFGGETGSARCPVLLRPRFSVGESPADARDSTGARLLREQQLARSLRQAWQSFRTSAASCFSFVESTGLWFAADLTRSSLPRCTAAAPRSRTRPVLALDPGPSGEAAGLSLDEQTDLAANLLKNLGLRGFGRLVLFCGHGSVTANNPYASSLDCGACGGHAGDVNARIAAAILNEPSVRAALSRRGYSIPADTWFLAGLHDTTTDAVNLFDLDLCPATHREDLAQLERWLAAASAEARRQRAGSLGLPPGSDAALRRRFAARSHDWSEVRPEWGLAGNAAFVAARSERTAGLDLGGRVFLHHYDARHDPDGTVLELILTAPMVVASWINLQYFASTVNQRLFGSGNKTLHNVVGTFGVWQGNGGDLQTGLPLQSLHDGTAWRHEPLRLSVVVEAAPATLARLLQAHPDVARLFAHDWLQLVALDPAAPVFHRYRKNGFEVLPP